MGGKSVKRERDYETRVMLPDKILKLGDKQVVMRPVPLDKMPSFIDAVLKIFFSLVEEKPAMEVMSSCIKEFLVILPYCVDTPISEIDGIYLADLMETFIDQNLTEERINRFLSLGPKLSTVTTVMGKKIQAIQGQQE